jgi:hypothetical protein
MVMVATMRAVVVVMVVVVMMCGGDDVWRVVSVGSG